jgi:CheY-like chemotaxis protein
MLEPINVLVVDDNPADLVLARKLLARSKILVAMDEARDGVEAFEFLRRQGRHADAARPDLILLDLNMPRMDGREVLRQLKIDPDLRGIPVVVLTFSTAERDVVKSYDLQASAYVVKPVDLDGFSEIVRAIEGFWFSVVRFAPGRGGPG